VQEFLLQNPTSERKLHRRQVSVLQQQLKQLQSSQRELQQQLEAQRAQEQQQQLAMVSSLEVGRTKTDTPAHVN
jgi:hypothetical protein